MDKTEQKIKEMFPQLLQDNLMSFSNLVVPPHRHNGVDSPTIPIQNIIIVPNVGIPFVDGTSQYNLFIDNTFSDALVLTPNATLWNSDRAEFDVGYPVPGNIFGFKMNRIKLLTEDAPGDPGTSGILLADENTNVTTGYGEHIDLSLGTAEIGVDTTTAQSLSTLLIDRQQYSTTNPTFFLQLPTSGTPTPTAGGIYFNGSTFFACADGATWQVINLI